MQLQHQLQHLRGDVFGGVTSAIVALPLAIAFGVSSGAGPLAGLYGAIFAGFFAAVFGGTRQQVTGPTGPMTVIMAVVVSQFSDMSAAFATVILAGFIQIILGKVGVGRYIRLVPQPVISGFMTGIGLIIIIVELPALLGHHDATGTVLQKLLALPQLFLDIHFQELLISSLTLLIMFITPKRVSHIVPAALLALLCCTLLANVAFNNILIIGEVPSGIPQPVMPSLSLEELPLIIRYAFMLALLGSIDSLLTSLVVDSQTRSNHDSNKELVGQGIGNIVAGLFGGLPSAGATMRSLVNVRSGGETRVSGALHSLLLLAIVCGFGSVVSFIPHAVLAGILIKVGIDIIDWPYLKTIHRAPRAGVVIMLTTLFVTIFVDLITAVAVGFVMASVLFVSRVAESQIRSMRFIDSVKQANHFSNEEKHILALHPQRIIVLELEGPLSFASARDVAKMMESHIHREVMLMDFTHIPFVDSSAAIALKEVIASLHGGNDRLVFFNAQPHIISTLDKLGVMELLGKEHVVNSRLNALRLAEDILHGKKEFAEGQTERSIESS